jgi:hypothetical protein
LRIGASATGFFGLSLLRSWRLGLKSLNLPRVNRNVSEFLSRGMNLAASERGFMQKNFSVVTDATGIVHIDRQTGVMLWEQEDLDPVLKQYAKKYLVSEGFLEQALGILDPLPDPEIVLFLDTISI